MAGRPISANPVAATIDDDDIIPIVQGGVTNKLALRPAITDLMDVLGLNVLNRGVAGDGVTDDLPAIQALVTAFGGTKTLRFPRGRYRLGTAGVTGPNRITLVSGTRIVCDPGAVFEVNQVDTQSQSAIFYAAGTDGTKTNMAANTAAGSLTITLPSGHGANFAYGDIIGIEAQTSAGSHDAGPHYVREIRKVMGVTGDVIRVDIALDYAYATSATAQFWKITPVKDLVLQGLRFEAGPGVTPGTDGSYAINLRKTLNARLADIELHHMIGGVRLHDAYDTSIDGLDGDSLPGYGLSTFTTIASYGYVLMLAASTTNVVVDRIRGRDCRHVVSTISDERPGSFFWGGPMFVEINNGIGFGAVDGFSIWDTHEFGRHINFNNCQAFGGGAAVTGFQMRGQDIQLNNCRALRCGLQGVAARKDSRNVQIIGGEYAYNASVGVALWGTDGHIVGARIHHNTSAGLTVQAATAVDNRISNCKIYENQYGILDGNLSVRTTIRDCDIPASATQTVAIVQPSATATIFGNTHLGYGTNLHGVSSVTSGCRIVGLVTDSAMVNNLAFNVGSLGGSLGYTETLYRGGASIVRTDAAMRASSFSVNGAASIFTGTGTPEGSVAAPVGTIYLRTGGGAATSFYVKETGTGNTGWVAK
jgi:hypothetical protein